MEYNQIDLEDLLNRHFDQGNFKPGQKEIISHLLSHRDVLAVAYRGFDQSICYKIPAMVLENPTLVVANTRRIVEKENSSYLPATHINSSLSVEHLNKRIRNIAKGDYRLIYATSEQFRNRTFLLALREIPISLFVIENAHRMSRWGHDFRPDYVDVIKFIMEMEDRPCILALASPCTRRTWDDISYHLQIDHIGSFPLDLMRPDLSLEARTALSLEEKHDVLRSIVGDLSGQGVIYANSRRQTVEIYEALKYSEPDAAFYHGGLEHERRIRVENAFAKGSLRLVITTTTGNFDKVTEHIRFVIHFDIPDRLERYYEHISMATGDEQPARCILIYCPSDRGFHHSIIERNAISPMEVWRVKEVLDKYGAADRWKPIHQPEDEETQEKRKLSLWLKEHFKHLSPHAQEELKRIKRIYENLTGDDKNPHSPAEYEKYLESHRWKEFSKDILAKHENCQICERKAQHVHHLHYRTLGREDPEDIMALCEKCHCFIHPDNPMTQKIFGELIDSEENQLKIFEPPKLLRPPLVIPYGQIELEAAVTRHKLMFILREMEASGMLEILPDCSIYAKAKILVPRGEIHTYVEDELDGNIIEWLLRNSETDPGGDITVDLGVLKTELSQPQDVLEDCIIKLQNTGAISYKPFRKGIALRLTNPDALPTDDVFEKLKAVRYKSLRDMESYINTTDCRQMFLAGYLGDERWVKCGICDNCIAEKSAISPSDTYKTLSLPGYARIALELVNKAEGKLDKYTLSRILAGIQQRTNRFDKWREFGSLSIFSLENVEQMLDFLIGHGFLKEEGGRYAEVDLTTKGFRILDGKPEPDDERSIKALAEDISRIAKAEKAELISESQTHTESDRILVTILMCAEKTDGQVGRSGLVKILLGQKSKKLAKYGFDHMEEYGILSDIPKKDLLGYIDNMIERGCLNVTSFLFPMIRITEIGQKRLERMQNDQITGL
jgi:RecQ family ATP-dependent DNA helicase